MPNGVRVQMLVLGNDVEPVPDSTIITKDIRVLSKFRVRRVDDDGWGFELSFTYEFYQRQRRQVKMEL